ncbi:uncharacterized protein ACO6RY_12929 [Pungitius sinensis]
MNTMLSLSLWLALMMLFCRGSREEETSTSLYPTDEYPTDEYPTDEYPTDEYDYTATFDYSIVTWLNRFDVNSQASRVSCVSPLLLLGLAVYQMWN